MKRNIAVCVGFCLLLAPLCAGEATDKLNKRLAEILNPKGSSVSLPGQAVELRQPKALQDPWIVPPPLQDLPPRPVADAVKPIRPRLTQEPSPLALFQGELPLPQEIVMPTTELIKLPLIDVQPAIPVAILSQPIGDRASLGDATVDASIAAALAQEIPLREQPVPFAVMNLPDPFELRQAVNLSNPPAESDMPRGGPPSVLLPPVTAPTK